MSPRTLVATSALFLLLSACGRQEPPAEQAQPAEGAAPAAEVQTDAEKVVNVYNWSDYIGRAHV